MEEANKLIGAGKVHLVKGKVVEAVTALQEACGLLAKKYGDTADECGEAFFWFGKALLDLARMENTVLGNALEGLEEEEEEEEEEEDEEKPKFPRKPKDSNIESTENVDETTRDELRVQVYDAMAEKKDGEKQEADSEKLEDGEQCTVEEKKPDDSKEKEAEEDSPKKKEEQAEEAEGTKEEEGDDAEMEADADGKGEGDNNAAEKESEEEEEGEEDELGNLQLAWEMLEVAKMIYKRKDTKEDQLMAAQTHLKLGEVSAESGNYTQALEDYKECLMLQKKHLESDSRLLAETHYQLGVTFSMTMQYKESIEELNNTISIINSRLETLMKLIDGTADADALPAERKEMEELKALLPDIQERVEDAKEGLKIASGDAMGVAKAMLDGSSSFSEFPVSNRHADTSSISTTNGKSVSSANGKATATPVSDISHLVRKKRKPEESPMKEHMAKKVKEEGHGTQESLTEVNGHANNVEVESK